MELLEILKNPKTTIVDVRTDFEYAEGHIDGAINIPLDEIPERLDEFNPKLRINPPQLVLFIDIAKTRTNVNMRL